MAMASSTEDLLEIQTLQLHLENLRNQVEREKDKVGRSFHELHRSLLERERVLLFELDQIVENARSELEDKKDAIQQLNTARNDLERNLTNNLLMEVREKNVSTLEDRIREELETGLTVGWVVVEWNERAIHDICNILTFKERPFHMESIPSMEISVRDKTHEILIKDLDCGVIQVFDSEGNYLNSVEEQITGPL